MHLARLLEQKPSTKLAGCQGRSGARDDKPHAQVAERVGVHEVITELERAVVLAR